jgi:hypothetical protein
MIPPNESVSRVAGGHFLRIWGVRERLSYPRKLPLGWGLS